MKQAFAAIDGASRGNPGPAGIGVVIKDESGATIKTISENIGETTNNVAEYSALIKALSEMLAMGFQSAAVSTDSELLAHQISGRYRVKNEGLAPLYKAARELMGKFRHITLTHVPREQNREADKLATSAACGKNGNNDDGSSARAAQKPKPKRREDGMVQRISVRTSSRTQFLNITRQVQEAVQSSGVESGACTVFVPHTTAGITINENADPDVVRDIIDTLDRLVPQSSRYAHAEGNSDSHVKASLMGSSVTVLVEDGSLVLGTWQGIYFCEFDGPRTRQVQILVGSR